MQKKQRVKYALAHAQRKYTAGTTECNDAIARIGRENNLSTGGGPLRTKAMHYTGARYW